MPHRASRAWRTQGPSSVRAVVARLRAPADAMCDRDAARRRGWSTCRTCHYSSDDCRTDETRVRVCAGTFRTRNIRMTSMTLRRARNETTVNLTTSSDYLSVCRASNSWPLYAILASCIRCTALHCACGESFTYFCFHIFNMALFKASDKLRTEAAVRRKSKYLAPDLFCWLVFCRMSHQ